MAIDRGQKARPLDRACLSRKTGRIGDWGAAGDRQPQFGGKVDEARERVFADDGIRLLPEGRLPAIELA